MDTLRDLYEKYKFMRDDNDIEERINEDDMHDLKIELLYKILMFKKIEISDVK